MGELADRFMDEHVKPKLRTRTAALYQGRRMGMIAKLFFADIQRLFAKRHSACEVALITQYARDAVESPTGGNQIAFGI